MFNILKNLLNDGKQEINYNEENTKQLDTTIHKSENFAENNIDIFKANKYSPLDEKVTEYTNPSPINQELFNLMKDQLKQKDLQISKLSELLNQGQDLHKNTQILFKQQQSEQYLLSLEDNIDNIDNNPKTIKINMKDHKQQKHKGFFGIIFEK